jgi:gamma-butyrobetaine dioxygenase
VTLDFPAAWLRHNCPCRDCRDQVTGQRLVEITSIPGEIQVAGLAMAGDEVEVTFTDGHRAVFGRAWLAAHALPATGAAGLGMDGRGCARPDPRTEDAKTLWRAADLAGPRPADGAASATAAPAGAASPPRPLTVGWAAYLGEDTVRERCLDAVARYGFAVLRGVPAEPGTVLAVAASFGFVRETNYGKLFDVRVQPDPANLAFTSSAIPPHTDNPYRDPVPTLQLLHCLRDASAGGDTGLVDGFAAAAALRETDPVSFAALTTTPVPFRYRDGGTELTACQPLISLSPHGRITCVRLNNRSMQPPLLPYAQAAALYRAYRAWAAIVARPEFPITFRLSPGDCLVFDNTRVLHARTAFSAPDAAGATAAAGAARERHLQGCYADIDGLLSTLAVLRRSASVTQEGT